MTNIHADSNVDDTFETPASAGRLIGLTPSGVNSAALRGRLPIAIRTSDGRRLYRRADCLKYRAERDAAIAALAALAETTR